MKSRAWELNFRTKIKSLGDFIGVVVLKSLITTDMFGAGDSSAKRIDIDPEDIRPSPEAVARYFGGPNYRLNTATYQRVTQGIQQAVEMVQPVLCYRAVPMEKVVQESGMDLSKGACADMLPDPADDHARHIAVYVGTLDNDLERRCVELAKQNRIYQSLLLDAVGTAMLDAMALICNEVVDMHSQQMGLFTGCRLGPGLNGIALESQALLFGLLGRESAGVQLNEAFVMQPAKSISGFVIYTDTEQRKPPGSKCLQCEMKHCQFRAARETFI